MKILSDLGYTDNAIALAQAKGRAAIDTAKESQVARQKAYGMEDGFDISKVEGISVKARQEKTAADKAEEAAKKAAEATATPAPVAEATKPE